MKIAASQTTIRTTSAPFKDNNVGCHTLQKDTVSFSAKSPTLNYTEMFRDDTDWEDFTKKMFEHFENAPKVEIIDHACSGGKEAYTIAIMLLKMYGPKEAEKFFPIKAKDSDPDIIKYAESRYINLSPREIEVMEQKYGIDHKKYFKKVKPIFNFFNKSSDYDNTKYKVRGNLETLVDFEQSDALEDLSKFDDNPNRVFLFRNAIGYLSQEQCEKFLDLLRTKLSAGNIFSLGRLWTAHGFDAERNAIEEISTGILKHPDPDNACFPSYHDDSLYHTFIKN